MYKIRLFYYFKRNYSQDSTSLEELQLFIPIYIFQKSIFLDSTKETSISKYGNYSIINN